MLAANTTTDNPVTIEEPKEANNIVIFPKPFVVPPIKDLNRTFMNNERFIQMHADLLADSMMEHLFHLTQEHGIPLTASNPDKLQNYTLLMTAESIKAVIYSVYGIRHPLHGICNDIFGGTNLEEEREHN